MHRTIPFLSNMGLTGLQHILTKKHRKFAENDENWSKLDALLNQLDRIPKYADDDDDASDY